MKQKKLSIIVFILLIILGLIFTYIINLPQTEKKVNFAIFDRESQVEDIPVDLPDYFYEPHAELTLLLRQKMWLHEEGAVNVNLTLPVISHEKIASLYEKYNYYYEVRMNLESVKLLSGDTIFAPIRPGQQSQFHWGIIPVRSGIITGNIWIYVHIANAAASQQWQFTRFALPLRIQVVDFFGLSLRNLRTFMILGLLLSVFLLMGFNLIGLLRRKP